MNFTEKLLQAAQRNNSLVCLGLDPDPELMPRVSVFEYNKAIIDATSDIVCAYKPNLAFYEALGIEGLTALGETVKYIPDNIPVIGDAKRSDIGHTARAYAKALFETFGFDAATVNPYLGYDSIEPFINYVDKGTLILCRTSNAGALDFQAIPCGAGRAGSEQQPLFKVVAQKAKEWDKKGNIGLVVGATYPQELKEIRLLCPGMVLLIPGIGAQGGDLASAVRYGGDAEGKKAIFSSSRQILYASKGKNFAQAARQAADELRRQINFLLSTSLTK
ncbi:MAG TPA: orotidine-5'-phosphate decarboxylase [Dehalococcoidia bacterium]|nr:orotidine-5'-phosphate decarboxylase [Dehalococcoidia bacterium]